MSVGLIILMLRYTEPPLDTRLAKVLKCITVTSSCDTLRAFIKLFLIYEPNFFHNKNCVNWLPKCAVCKTSLCHTPLRQLSQTGRQVYNQTKQIRAHFLAHENTLWHQMNNVASLMFFGRLVVLQFALLLFLFSRFSYCCETLEKIWCHHQPMVLAYSN